MPEMDDIDEDVIPSDEELRKRLFSSPSPEKDSEVKKREGEGRSKARGRGNGGKAKRKNRKSGFRLSLLAVMLFLVLCALALIVTLHFNDRWRWITWTEAQEGAARFFSNTPLNGEEQTTELFSLLGALPLALSIGMCTGVFTCLFMYYDSDVPGDFPPTPVSSPRKGVDPSPMESRWHLGYIFVPVNTLVAFSLALVYLRVHLGLGIV